MRTQILLLGLGIINLFACVQTPPQQISNAFNAKFKNAEKVSWNQEEANEWKVIFIQNGRKTSAEFNLSGNWLETATAISKKELPITVKSAMAKKYTDYTVKESAIMDSPKFSGYEIVLEKGKTDVEIQIDVYGEIMTKKDFTKKKPDVMVFPSLSILLQIPG